MSLESLGNVIRSSSNNNSLNRIYRAHVLQEKIIELLGGGVTVSLRGEVVKLWCDSEQLAVLAKLKKTKLLALCHKTLSQKVLKLSIKLSASRGH